MSAKSPKSPTGRTPQGNRTPTQSDRATKSGRRRLPFGRRGATTPPHEGGTESEVGDRTGPGAGYDDEPEQIKDKGGVA